MHRGRSVLPLRAGGTAGFGLVWFYSGERGGSSKLEQWAFYWFYPAHIFVLGILTNLLLFR